MRNIKLIGLTILLLAPCLETPCRADVSFTITPMQLPLLPPEQNLRGFCACQIDAFTTDGSLISALDVNFEGRFHQRWRDIDFDGIADPTPNGSSADGRGDSHLTTVSGALVGRVLVENNNIYPSPLPDGVSDYGIGTFMRGAWGIPGASQSSTASVGYLVMAQRDSLFFTLDYAVATSNGTFEGTVTTPLVFLECIPEPSALLLGLIGMCGVAAVRRRR